MKKKIALAAVIILLLSVAGYSTYAYLTASTTARNVITAGTVKIELTDVSEELEVSSLLEAGESSEYVMPNTEKPGNVFVKNTGGNDCYVRVKLEPTIESASETSLSTDKITLQLNDVNWVKDTDGYWRYNGGLENGILKPGDETSNLLTSIIFDKSMGNEYQNSIIHISVSAQAVQAAHNPSSVLDVLGWPEPSPAP